MINVDEAARLIHINGHRIRMLAKESYVRPSKCKGFYRLGDVADGHAEAIRMKAVAAPYKQEWGKIEMACEVKDRG